MTWRYAYYALSVCLCLNSFAGCAASQTRTSAFLPSQSSAARAANGTTSSETSWMAPGAKEENLLYVASDWGPVYVFSYPQGDPAGILMGLDANGLCVDGDGNVFVTDLLRSDIVEYAHGSIAPIETLQDGGYMSSFPTSCSVSPATGDLAVTDGGSNTGDMTGTGPGKLAIYKHAKGNPEYYAAMDHPHQCSYDLQGNLFVDGATSFTNGNEFRFGELSRGAKRFRYVVLPQAFSGAGGVKWDGAHIAVGDAYRSVIYQFVINGRDATEVGSTPLVGTNLTWNFSIYESKVVVPVIDNVGSENLSTVLLYNYPSGGQAVKTIVGRGIVLDPTSAAISPVAPTSIATSMKAR
jgi:hypothetical protein